MPRRNVSASSCSNAASARLSAFLAQHCGSLLIGFSKKRSKAVNNSGISGSRRNSRTRSAALPTTKLFRCPNALRSGSMQDSGDCWRRPSKAAICSSNVRLPGTVESVTREHTGRFFLSRASCPPETGRGRGIVQLDSCRVFLRKESDRSLEASSLKQGNHGNSHQSKAQGGTGKGGEGKDRHLHNPIEDRLIPLEPLDLAKVHSIDDLVRAMSKTAFTGRQLGEAADVLEATGRAHFRHNPEVSDEELYEQGYNRVYDTLEPEQNLDDVEEVMAAVLESWDHNEIMCSYKLNHAIGEHLARNAKDQRGILKSAYEQGVPVFVPAFTDSELGLDVALNNRLRESTGRHRVRFDPFEDLEHFAATLLRQKKLGIVTIGGGVPRNWSQQFGPFCELRHRRLGENVPLKRYHYGLRICPEPVYWGGLSGSPYSEAVSWGKFVPPAEGGRFGEVFVDATVGLPLIVAAVLERLGKAKPGKAKG